MCVYVYMQTTDFAWEFTSGGCVCVCVCVCVCIHMQTVPSASSVLPYPAQPGYLQGGPAVPASRGLLEMYSPGSVPHQLNQNLHFNKVWHAP